MPADTDDRRRIAQRVSDALDGVEDRHVKAERRRDLICEYVHMWMEPPHSAQAPNGPDGPPPLQWVYEILIANQGWTISPSTVRSIHRRYCRRTSGRIGGVWHRQLPRLGVNAVHQLSTPPPPAYVSLGHRLREPAGDRVVVRYAPSRHWELVEYVPQAVRAPAPLPAALKGVHERPEAGTVEVAT